MVESHSTLNNRGVVENLQLKVDVVYPMADVAVAMDVGACITVVEDKAQHLLTEHRVNVM
jgi:hypothetical protein